MRVHSLSLTEGIRVGWLFFSLDMDLRERTIDVRWSLGNYPPQIDEVHGSEDWRSSEETKEVGESGNQSNTRQQE